MAKKRAYGKSTKKTKKPKRAKNPGAKSGRVGGAPSDKRLAAVERSIGIPHEIQDVLARLNAKRGSPQTTAARVLKNFPELADDQPVRVELTDVEFDLDNEHTTAFNVRLYFEGSSEDIASKAKPHGVVPRQIVGSTLILVMDVQGDPDDVGVFKVKHTRTPSISLKVSDGPVSLKSLFVEG